MILANTSQFCESHNLCENVFIYSRQITISSLDEKSAAFIPLPSLLPRRKGINYALEETFALRNGSVHAECSQEVILGTVLQRVHRFVRTQEGKQERKKKEPRTMFSVRRKRWSRDI